MNKENLRERVVRTAYEAARAIGSVSVRLRRGRLERTGRGFCDGGESFAETRGKTFSAFETRTLVVERSFFEELFPPRPRDAFSLTDSSGARRFEVFAPPNAPYWYYWNRDARYVAIELKEVEK